MCIQSPTSTCTENCKSGCRLNYRPVLFLHNTPQPNFTLTCSYQWSYLVHAMTCRRSVGTPNHLGWFALTTPLLTDRLHTRPTPRNTSNADETKRTTERLGMNSVGPYITDGDGTRRRGTRRAGEGVTGLVHWHSTGTLRGIHRWRGRWVGRYAVRQSENPSCR